MQTMNEYIMANGVRSQKWLPYLESHEHAARSAGWQCVLAWPVLVVGWYLSWTTSWFHWTKGLPDERQADVIVIVLLVGALFGVGLFSRWLHRHDQWIEANWVFRQHTVLDYLNDSQQRNHVYREIKTLLNDWSEGPGDHRFFATDFEELWKRRFPEEASA